jgi:hypothetical protein
MSTKQGKVKWVVCALKHTKASSIRENGDSKTTDPNVWPVKDALKFSVDMPFKNSVTKYHNVVVGWCGLRLLDESFRNLPLLFSFLRSI